jgi:hypothetical protein
MSRIPLRLILMMEFTYPTAVPIECFTFQLAAQRPIACTGKAEILPRLPPIV